MAISDVRQFKLEHAGAPLLAASPLLTSPAASGHSGLPGPTAAVLRSLKRLATHLPLQRQAALVARLLPPQLWYGAALRMARAQGRLVERMGGNRVLTTELMLDFWLRELSFSGPYPIPYQCQGLELCLMPGPKLFSWTHLPLTEAPLRPFLEASGAPLAVVADPGKIVGDNQFQVFGWAQRLQGLITDGGLLRRVMGTLRGGTSVVFLSDPYMGGPLSEVPVRLAGRAGVPLIFQWTELAGDGTLLVTFREAPCPYSRTEEEIAQNMAFLRDARACTLDRLGWSVRVVG